MDWTLLTVALLVPAAAVTLLAAYIKGAVGFAMPMIMISGLASFLDPETALAMLIPVTLYTNMVQALRQGLRAAYETARRFWRYLGIVLVMLAFSAQLVRVLPQDVVLMVLGVVVIWFGVVLLSGWTLQVGPRGRRAVETGLALLAGGVGGISGVWGPQTVMYLTILEVPKVDAVRAQGVIYGLGSVVLLTAHWQTGVLNAATLPPALAMLPVCAVGLWLGFKAQDRMDQARFRQATLVVLILAGLNLIRRGLVLG